MIVHEETGRTSASRIRHKASGRRIANGTCKVEFPDAPAPETGGRTVFEWLPGVRLLVQRWETSHDRP